MTEIPNPASDWSPRTPRTHKIDRVRWRPIWGPIWGAYSCGRWRTYRPVLLMTGPARATARDCQTEVQKIFSVGPTPISGRYAQSEKRACGLCDACSAQGTQIALRLRPSGPRTMTSRVYPGRYPGIGVRDYRRHRIAPGPLLRAGWRAVATGDAGRALWQVIWFWS